MPTSSSASKASLKDGLRKCTSLPPIPSLPDQENSSLPEHRAVVRRKLLRYSRSKQQQHELHKTMVAIAAKAYKKAKDTTPEDSPYCEPQFPSTMMSEARKQRMNYMFLKQCVESRPIVPIQQQWLDNMSSLIPPQLRLGPGRTELLEELCEEVRENFLSTMVRFTVDSMLQKPQMDTDAPLQKSPAPNILDFSRPWHNNFIRSRKKIKENLHILHPVMKVILDTCYITFSQLLLVDISDCRYCFLSLHLTFQMLV